MFYNDQVVFVHPPLSGGNSVCRSFGFDPDVPTHVNGHTLLAHATAEEIRDVLGAEAYDSRWSFAVFRNPWKRMVSMFYRYTWETKLRKHFGEGETFETVKEKTKTFRGFVLDYPDNPLHGTSGRMRDSQFFWARGVNDIFDMEDPRNLERRMLGFGLAHGIAYDHRNPRRPDVPYQEYYDEETHKLVETWFAEDIALFNYTF